MYRPFITIVIQLLVFQIIFAQVQHPVLTFTTAFSGFSSPVDIANAGDGSHRIFIVERGGKVKVVKNGTVLSTPFIDLTSKLTSPRGGEQGLLGIAFHPNYISNGYFYVNYTDSNGDTKIERYTRSSNNPDLANAASALLVLSIDQIDDQQNHNGGCLKFGPDGYLYIAMGDGGGGGDPDENSQDGSSLLGKMLRINIDGSAPYTIPAGNPFVGNANIEDEIWAMGLRNPWRFSFDSETGDLWIADVGQTAKEEVNFQPASSSGGENYGWDCYEGNNPYESTGCGSIGNYDFPIFDYPRDTATGGRSISGGLVYRGNNLCLNGFYICADYISNNVWTIAPNGANWSTQIHKPNNINGIVAFGASESGNVYAVTLGGSIFQIGSENETVSGNPIPEDSYATPGILFSDGRIATGDEINFSAGEAIQLDPSFQVDQGGQLNGVIGCP